MQLSKNAIASLACKITRGSRDHGVEMSVFTLVSQQETLRTTRNVRVYDRLDDGFWKHK